MKPVVLPLILVLLLPLAAAADTLRLGWTAWSDAEITSRMAKFLIEKHTEHRVDRVLADIGIQYSGVASGDLDFMLMSWQPETHRDYLDKFAAEIEDLGVLYEGATLGWAVPGYVPVDALGSLEDLARPGVASRLGWRIQGVDPGAGLTRLSEAALEAYGLERYQLQYASGAGMAVALRRAIDRRQWLVVTAWRPHWIFGQHSLRFLDDPKAVLSRDESVHAIARPGFRRDYPRVAALLARMHLTLDELEAIMLAGETEGYQHAVEEFVRTHSDRIDKWLEGQGMAGQDRLRGM